ncbi:hypothetical protein [Microbacterium sp. P05]|uniref:hypothetical protein n=1 Tax=Microbacterium sp. P05 TaxID=3366948 RepID=UPI003746B388
MNSDYVDWLAALDDFVRDMKRFNVGRQDADLRADYELMGTPVANTTAQFNIQTAVWQLGAALKMQAIGTPPSAVPVLVRAAMEAATSVAWFLAPDDVNTRVERIVQLALQDSYDQFRFEGANGTEAYETRRRQLLAPMIKIGLTEGYFRSNRYSVTQALVDLEASTGENDLVPLWSLLSGLAHGRPWAILASSGADTSGGGVVQTYVPREQYGFYQLRAAELLDTAIGYWNERVGSMGTLREVPRLPRTLQGRAHGLPASPWSWSPA